MGKLQNYDDDRDGQNAELKMIDAKYMQITEL